MGDGLPGVCPVAETPAAEPTMATRRAKRGPRPRSRASRAARRAKALPPIESPIQLELTGGAGLYTLPSLKDLAQGARTWSTPRPTTR